jgi:2-dehydropantoate 2-reductase
MHYGVIGMGPVGATFAAMLSQGGYRVSVLDANPHRAELFKMKPLKVQGYYKADIQLKEVHTSFYEFAENKPDVVLMSVKAHTIADIVSRIKNSPLAKAAVISCQNGIDTELEIAKILGDDQAFRMVLNFGVTYSSTHEVNVNFLNEPHFFSPVSKNRRQFAEKIVEEFSTSGVKLELVDDIRKEVFKKTILNTSLGSICALTRMTMAEVMNEDELTIMVNGIIREGIAVCKAYDIDIPADFHDKAIAYLARGSNHKPSILVDIETGRQTEVRYLAGKLFEYAREKDIAVPVTQSVFYLIKSLEKSLMLRRYVNSPAE